ncbi:hypothetical protein D7V97_06335 [Corallococcus sp. CA053C]|uniref:hypothetical protein n=1 Tax=Corallococcus sp. CA053C TaxID=2316732 RepID=UPI000EA17DCA|nr:hypothetical protein [Corallococcus sp. CA053C]RKH13182.1 hypothetical protein D7V97_06335 [Corallococcus sp. CA053C]
MTRRLLLPLSLSLLAACAPEPAPREAPATGAAWQSYAAALSDGLSVNAPNLTTTSVMPVPATDASINAMLNSAIWKQTTLQVGHPVSNGNYQVYLWVMENHQSNSCPPPVTPT